MRSVSLSLLILIVFSSSAIAQSDIKLKLGAKLPKEYLSKKVGLTMTAMSQLDPFIKVTIEDVDYLIAYEGKTRKIKYINTRDEDFRTSTGLKVGDEIEFTVDDLDINLEIRAPAGPDGWFPVIGHNSPFGGIDSIEKLKRGEKATMSIDGFSKGGG